MFFPTAKFIDTRTRQELLHSLNRIIALIAANQIDLGRANLLNPRSQRRRTAPH